MKRILAIVTALGLLVLGAMAYAHYEEGQGGPGYGPGYGQGSGYGPGHGGCGNCPGWAGDESRPGKIDPEKRDAFFKESRDIRKKLHDRQFDLREAYEADDEKKIDAIEAEIEKLQEELAKMAEKYGFKPGKSGRRGGRHMGPGYGPGMMGPGY